MAHSMVGNDANIGGTYPQRIWNCLSTMSKAMTLKCGVVSSIVLADKADAGRSGDTDTDLVMVVANILGASDPTKLDHKATLGDLGLDSLMGVEVKQALERADIRLSSKEIRNLTLEAISGLQNGGGDQTSESKEPTKDGSEGIVVELKKVADTTPLYLIHPITLDLTPLKNIAQHLGRTVYGVQLTSSAPLDTVENLASHYLAAINSHRGSASFRLGGYSFGAVVAFEIALQCKGEGMEGGLCLIDGSPNWVRGQIEGGKEEVLKMNRAQLQYSTESVLSYVRRNFGDQAAEGMYEKITHLNSDTTAQTKLALSFLKETRPRMDIAEHEAKCEAYVRLILMADGYKPSSLLSAPVHLLRAKDSFQDGEDYGLSELCSGKVHVDSVDGDHETCVSEHQLQIAKFITMQS
eukprot:sb/3465231/